MSEKVLKQRGRDEPDERKRAKRGPTTENQSAVIITRVLADDVLLAEGLKEKDGALYCGFCKKFVNSTKMQKVQQHVFGKVGSGEAFAAQPEETKLALGHYSNMVAALERKKRGAVLAAAIEQHRSNVVAQSDQKRAAAGATLPLPVVQDRIAVGLTMLGSAIPFEKLNEADFAAMVRDEHHSIGSRTDVSDHMPVILDVLRKERNGSVAGRVVAVVFDGAKVNENVEVCVVRYLDDAFEVKHATVGVSLISKNMTSAALNALVREQLRCAGVEVSLVICATSDSASINRAMASSWNEMNSQTNYGVKFVEQQLLWLGCIAHALSNAGKALRAALPSLKSFLKGFKKMTNTSDAARGIWLDECKSQCPGLADNRWWAFYDTVVDIERVWTFVPAFLREAAARTVAKSSVKRMASEMDSPLKRERLLFELRCCITLGKNFRDATLLMESNGFTLPFVEPTLIRIHQAATLFSRDPSVSVLLPSLDEIRRVGYQNDVGAAMGCFVAAGRAVFQHFDRAVLKDMAPVLPLFTSAQLFHPVFVEYLSKQQGDVLGPRLPPLLSLKPLAVETALSGQTLEAALRGEWAALVVASKQQAEKWRAAPDEADPAGLLQWWRSLQRVVPTWFRIFTYVVLIQPSSAFVERLFSVIKVATTPQQNREYPETFEARVLALTRKLNK